LQSRTTFIKFSSGLRFSFLWTKAGKFVLLTEAPWWAATILNSLSINDQSTRCYSDWHRRTH